MRDFLLGVTLLGAIIWLTSFAPNAKDQKLYESYCEKTSRGEVPTGTESFVYWGSKFVSLGVPLMIVGIFGLVLYYIF